MSNMFAGILEVTWAVFMKMTEGFTKAVPSIITGIAYVASAVFLALALRKLPLGTAYAHNGVSKAIKVILIERGNRTGNQKGV